MTAPRLPFLFLLALLAGCLSQSDPPEQHYYTTPLPELEGVSVPGTRPLRFDSVQSPPILSTRMLWRMSETEVSTDDSSSWALHPADVLDSRTRDRLFSRAGYRESLTPGAPLLVVRVETMEGSVEGDGSARVEFVADFWTSDGTQHRERFVEVEALDERSHDGLARGMATVIDRASAKLVAWVVERG